MSNKSNGILDIFNVIVRKNIENVYVDFFKEPLSMLSKIITTILGRFYDLMYEWRKSRIHKEQSLKIYEEKIQKTDYIETSLQKNRFLFLLKKVNKNKIHPAFSSILKQLSKLDIEMIENGRYLDNYQPIIRIFACEEISENGKDLEMYANEMSDFDTSNLKIPVFSHFSSSIDGSDENETDRCISIYNLHRLGLINTDYFEKIISPDKYKELYNSVLESEIYKKAIEEAKKNDFHVCFTRGYTSPTEFGRLFYKVCCVPKS